ncbi:MAG: ATP-dependent helicase RecG, partial [Conexibacter sp.]|nr:ATP-dependent helicase RecG [Conexibacter sp.]
MPPPIPPIAFAEPRELSAEELWSSPTRTPRPSRLSEPLDIKNPTAAAAAESMGLETVGALLEHLPRATGEARTIGELALDETATVLVEVRSITTRPVRRRGMKPLVEATVSDGTGIMKATFFNQPWLSAQYPVGTRLMLAG